jgi:hypothetical protein
MKYNFFKFQNDGKKGVRLKHKGLGHQYLMSLRAKP